MLGTPFLTLLDPNAKIKGSRDPLGLQPIWTHFGRRVVRNLTTVTTSVRGFTTLLLGLYFAERVVEDHDADAGRYADLFLQFEQLAAYSRVACSTDPEQYAEDEIRGIQRVKKNLASKKIIISARQENQILANQKTYGLWGLYSVAARNSGWLENNSPRLTPIARDFVEAEYLARLGPDGQPVIRLLNADSVFEPHGKHQQVAQNLAQILGKRLTLSETEFYGKHLLACGSDGLQLALWKQIERTGFTDGFSMSELREVIKRSRVSGNLDLTERLEAIQYIEIAIGPMARLFSFLLSQNQQPIAQVVTAVRSTWGPRLKHIDVGAFSTALDSACDKLGSDTCTRLQRAAAALGDGRYQDVVGALLEQNVAVMRARGGGSWLNVNGSDLDVHYREEAAPLPARDELSGLWTNSYFINALKAIGQQIYAQGGPV
jgi:hypothetical protein